MSIKTLLGLAAALLVASASVAAAQTATPAAPAISKPAAPVTATAKKAKAPKAKKATAPAKPRSEISIACSAKADTAGPNGGKLTGKPRQNFRKKCMKAGAA